MSQFSMYSDSRPYVADYAASGRARCKGCRDLIPQGQLRLAVLAPSKHHKGIDPNWFHVGCFFQTRKNVKETDFSKFEKLDFDDQQLIRHCLNGGKDDRPKVPLGSSTLHNMRNKNSAVSSAANIAGKALDNKPFEPIVFPNSGQFYVEYAKSNQSHCVLCTGRIAQNEVRISQKDFSSDKALQLQAGCIDRWSHAQCFIRCRVKLEFFDSANSIPGFSSLTQVDRDFLSVQLPKIPRPKNAQQAGKENSSRDSFQIVDEYYQKKSIELQNVKIEALKKSIISNGLNTSEHLSELLLFSKQEVPLGMESMMERVVDAMLFGALEPCSACQGQIVLRNNVGYYCTGYVTEFIKCKAAIEDPPRRPFQIPTGLLSNPFLKDFTFTPLKRFVISRKRNAENDKDEPLKKLPKIDKLPLFKRKIVVSDNIEETQRAEIVKKIEQFGGKVMRKMTACIFILICTNDEIQSEPTGKIKFATDHGIPIVSETFVDSISEVDFTLSDAVLRATLHPC